MVRGLVGKGLSMRYQAQGPDVLQGVDLTCAEGELVALIGPNGAGKTTLLRILGGLLKPTRGTVLLGGQPLFRLSPRQRARELSYVPQGVRALADMSVRSFVASGRYAHLSRFKGLGSKDRAAIERALIQAELEEEASRPLDAISGGQRQRALLARAAVQESPVLLVDEPTSSLDPGHQILIFRWLLRVVREGCSALVVTHELNLASLFASRVVLLEEGQVRAEGSPQEVLTKERLTAVYGPYLHCGRLLAGPWGEERPFAIPWI